MVKKLVDGPVGGGGTVSYRPPEAVAAAYLHSVCVSGGFRVADTAKYDTSGFGNRFGHYLSSQRGNSGLVRTSGASVPSQCACRMILNPSYIEQILP